MKKSVFLSGIFLFICSFFYGQNSISLEEILPHIHRDSLKKTMEDMQSFPNRFVPTGNRDVAQYLMNRFEEYGIQDCRIDSFEIYHTSVLSFWIYNVTANIPGSSSDSTVIIGAHLDAIAVKDFAIQWDSTAGADDNASGISVMIEMARIIHQFNLSPYCHISFTAFDGEELGLYGAYKDVMQRGLNEEKIKVMMNNDMVSYHPEDSIWHFNILWYDDATDIARTAKTLADRYTTLSAALAEGEENESREYSDSWAYAQAGIPSIFFKEHYFSPYYHTLMDRAEFSNFDYLAEVARLNFAFLHHFAFRENATSTDKVNFPSPVITVLPNPASEYIEIRSKGAVPAHIILYDSYGKSCRTLLADKEIVRIDVSTLPAGLYILSVTDNKGSNFTRKIIKI